LVIGPLNVGRKQELRMADKRALGMIGLMMSIVTLLVMTVGAVVVGDQLTGRLQIDDGTSIAMLAR
jgi:hypothetical protein